MSSLAAPPRPWVWGGLFMVSTGLIAAGHIFDVIEQPVPIILFLLSMLLMIPWFRSARTMLEQRGAMSPALRRYNGRAIIAMVAYCVTFIVGSNLFRELPPGSAWIWLLALVPVLALMGMLWAMWRYYCEEEDEYLRHRAVTGALIGLMVVLVFGTAWGFLEMFGLVVHMWNWWVFPVWAIGMGLGRCLPRRGGDEVGEP